MLSFRVCFRVVVCAALLTPVSAAPPDWWSAPETAVIDPVGVPNNYAPVNLGQLKHVAQQAKSHLNAALASIGGAGPEIESLVSGFHNSPSTNNYAPANLGQLKAVAKRFYDRIIAVGYKSRQNLIDQGYPPEWTGRYPWDPATPVALNFAPANIGQLKMVFSFDLAGISTSRVDADEDGLLDEWEVLNGHSPFNTDGNADGLTDSENILWGKSPFGYISGPADLDSDNDGLTNSEEIVLGTNPLLADTDGDGTSDSFDMLPTDASAFGVGSSVPGPPLLTLLAPPGAVLVP